MVMSAPDISDAHRELCRRMAEKAFRGWYVGTMETLERNRAFALVPGATEPELEIRLQLTRDKMHHSVGWWRNAEYEYCWHLSISAWEENTERPTSVPKAEERYWTFAFFPQTYDKVWHEPGGTDPRLTPQEKIEKRHIIHQRVFLDPETFEPFIPKGEVYDITRWLPITPDKVDR